MTKSKSVLFRNVSGTKPTIFLVSFFTFFISFCAFISIGMGLHDGTKMVQGIILVITFLVFSLPLLFASYLLGKFSKEKKFSSLSYSAWSFMGTLPLYFLLPNAFSGIDFYMVITVMVIGSVYAAITYLGTTWGHK